nr:MAG TPA: hypothetical protein [Caudoviricetes sp.]
MNFSSSSFGIIFKISMALSSVPWNPSYLFVVIIKEAI